METVEADRHKLLAILSSMVEGVIAVDAQEQIMHVNDVARDLLGLRSGKLARQPIQLTVPVPEVCQILRESMEALEPKQLEIVHHTAQEDRVLSLHAAPLRGAGSEVTGAALVIHDLTALRQLETLRRDFVANVSHELKTPLTAMTGFVETILDDDDMLPETRKSFLEKTQNQTSRLTSLVKDLLTLSRVESQAEDLERALVDLSEPARASVLSLQDAAIAGGLELETEWPDPPLYVRGDPEALQQAADNLLSNAIRYTQPGGKVSLRVYRWGEDALLEVQDTGIGFEAAHGERVFERFYRVDKARSRALGGTGLGLSIVKHIALAHGGRISAQSRVGEGSTFSLCLPRASPGSPQDPEGP
jgi:two-component system phosphate regulon sensor histidine kinase PhoR